MLDAFSISYTMDSSAATENVIGVYEDDTWWQVWELFGGDIAFTFVPDEPGPSNVPAPSSIALLALGLLSFGISRRRKAQA